MPLVGALVLLLLVAAVYVAAERRRLARETAASAIALRSPSANWTTLILGDTVSLDVRERTAIVRRLGVVASAWAIAVLESALADEPDASVREAIWQTLIIVRTDESTFSRNT